jgi:hypothetical protein
MPHITAKVIEFNTTSLSRRPCVAGLLLLSGKRDQDNQDDRQYTQHDKQQDELLIRIAGRGRRARCQLGCISRSR